MLNDLQNVNALIKAYEEAIAHHDRLFNQDASQEVCAEALGPINDALIAICADRPTSPEGRQRRRKYLAGRLFEDTDGCAGLIKAVFDALLADPVDSVKSGEKSP